MAKTKVFSRFPNPIEFRFYPQNLNGGENITVGDEDRIVLNGTSEVVNHTLITKDGALTLFGFDHHDVQKREYSAEDLERMKLHPVFQHMLKNGDVSIGTMEDLSRDMNGIGMLSNAELASRTSRDPDGKQVVMKSSN